MSLRALKLDQQRPLVIGHRGAMGHCPENTLASFERAAELGADWVELDVHRSRDGAVVVIHDETLERTTNGTGRVVDHTLPELKRLDAGQGQRIPTLDEVLVWARARGVGVDIEIKNAPVYYDGIEQALVEAVERGRVLELVLVSSFDHPAVRRIKSLDVRVATGVLYAHRPVDPVRLAREVGADMLLPHWPYVVPEDVQAAQAAGLGVATWASSDPSVLRRLVSAGVDAIATNHPDVLRRVLKGEID